MSRRGDALGGEHEGDGVEELEAGFVEGFCFGEEGDSLDVAKEELGANFSEVG